jgi:hypothetical protein
MELTKKDPSISIKLAKDYSLSDVDLEANSEAPSSKKSSRSLMSKE